MPPINVITQDENSRNAACACCAIALGPALLGALFKFPDSVIQILFLGGCVVGIIVGLKTVWDFHNN